MKMNEKHKILERCFKVIDSCVLYRQLEMARKYIVLSLERTGASLKVMKQLSLFFEKKKQNVSIKLITKKTPIPELEI